jgi:trans-aconitate 2-methyltransferase
MRPCSFGSGSAEQHVRVQVYPHVLDSREEVIEWVQRHAADHYQRRVPPSVGEVSEAYRAELFHHLPDERPFSTRLSACSSGRRRLNR